MIDWARSRFVYPRKSYFGGRIQSVLHRFLAQRMYIEGVKQMSALQRFILEVLDGRRIHDRSVCKFDIFVTILEPHLVWWPLCYIFCILSRSISFCSRNQDRDWPQLGAYCAVRPLVALHLRSSFAEDDSEEIYIIMILLCVCMFAYMYI